jgi:hypothetical protein
MSAFSDTEVVRVHDTPASSMMDSERFWMGMFVALMTLVRNWENHRLC